MMNLYLDRVSFVGCVVTLVHGYNEVCYGDLGCFTDGPPFGGTKIRMKGYLPDEPSKVNTVFFLSTRKSRNKIFTSEIIPPAFNATVPTRFIIHGFIQSTEKPWMGEMTDALLRTEELNVINVDWKDGAVFPYAQASSNTQIVGAEIAKLIKNLISKSGANIKDFHLIGHSLGAHVAGYAGERLENLARITGLDPAGPLFEFTDPAVRLDPTDARFVDVIHTDGVSILQIGLGLAQPSGDVDFFPNGGVDQPGCPATSIKLLSAILHFATSNLEALDNYSGCSHVAAYKFFTESIENKGCFTAYPCSSKDNFDKGNCIKCSDKGCNNLGYWSQLSKQLGNLYLNTQDASNYPFCKHNFQVRLISNGSKQALGKIKISFEEPRSNEQLIDNLETKFNSNSVTQHLASINSNLVGKIDRIFLSYERTTNIFSSWLYDAKWSFSRVEIFNGESQLSYKYCPRNGGLIGSEPIEFNIC